LAISASKAESSLVASFRDAAAFQAHLIWNEVVAVTGIKEVA
jgi:hypothetical protein